HKTKRGALTSTYRSSDGAASCAATREPFAGIHGQATGDGYAINVCNGHGTICQKKYRGV
ncbi:MAG: hypothetical protein ACPIOQ_07105, partial [Promethearchaeia archaeon]